MILVHDREMVEVNRACFGRTGGTDVISIAYPPFPPGARAGRGEIVVNADQALREGNKRNGPARELALYVAHGCNHLGGRDDATPAERVRMRRRENDWLRRPDIQPWIESCLEEHRPDA